MIKILIVEDEQSICDLINLHLSAVGYRCVCIRDGMEAINQIEGSDFDLILLDIMLPGASGFEVMEYIQPLGIPVIFISAKHEVKDRVKGLKLGADDYLIKPFDIVELLARVERVLRRYQKAEKQVVIDDVLVDLEARTVMKNGRPVEGDSMKFSWKVFFCTIVVIAVALGFRVFIWLTPCSIQR